LGEQARERAKQQLQWKQLAGQMLAAYERLRDRRTGKGLLEK
jgi:hypothetical protein